MQKENAVALIKQDRNYVSVFEDPSTYKAKMEIASALSRDRKSVV